MSYTLQEALATRGNTEGDDALDIGDDSASKAPLEVKRILTPSLHLLRLLQACVSEPIQSEVTAQQVENGEPEASANGVANSSADATKVSFCLAQAKA